MDGGELECYDEELQIETRTKWEHAMDKDMKSLILNHSWDLVPLPEGKNELNKKWV